MEHFNWGLPVAIDLFTAALGAATFMIAVLADFAGIWGRKYRKISTVGAIIAPWPVILGVLLLVVDLGKPLRFWEMLLRRGSGLLTLEYPFLMFKIGSTMSIGTWLLTIFVVISLVYLVLAILSWPFKWGGILQKLVGLAGLPFALLITVYTGVLISSTNNPLWNNFTLPLVFVASAFVTGIAAIIFVLAILQLILPSSKIGVNIFKLEKLNGYLIMWQLIVLALFIGSGIAAPQMLGMITTQFGILFWIGIVLLGLVLPLLIGLKGGSKHPGTALVSSVLLLLGGFFLRYVILIGGQI